MTVVVTGAGGHVGGNLVRALLERGRKVRVLVRRDRRALEGLGVEEVQGDTREPGCLHRAFEGADVVYHLAGHISLNMHEWPLLESTNVVGTRNVAQACLDCGVRRLVHFSSVHAYAMKPVDIPLDEEWPLAEAMEYPPYDRSKAAGQREIYRALDRGLDAVIINPTGILGPYDLRPSHFGDVLLALAKAQMPALIDAGFDWVDVRDVAAGAMRAEEVAPTGSRYLLSGHWVSIADVAAGIHSLTGVKVPRLVAPLWMARLGAPFSEAFGRLRGKRPLYTKVSLKDLEGNHDVSHERAARELGYQPRPFSETLADTLGWFAQWGYIPPLRSA